MIPKNHVALVESIRKAVRQIGKEAAIHRFTPEEKQALRDIRYTYAREGIMTSENELARIAIYFLVEDYHQNREGSMLAWVLAALNA